MSRRKLTISSLRRYTPYVNPGAEIIFDRYWDDSSSYMFVLSFLLEHRIRFYMAESFVKRQSSDSRIRSTMKLQIAKGFEEQAVLLKLSL